MRKIRYIKFFLVIGVIVSIGLCALILITQINSRVQEPYDGARLILNNDSVVGAFDDGF